MTHSITRLHPIPIEEISAARQQIQAFVKPSLLTRLDIHGAPSEVYLKLENLHPVGSFKLRGVVNALSAARPETLDNGIWTASAGNMGYALAWVARRRNIACAVIVPENAPASKLAAIARQGAQIEKVPFHVYQEIQRRHTWSGLLDCPPDSPLNGLLIHPFADPAVMAGNGTIGLEILEDLPEVDAVLVPYGGGGLSCGIASAIKALKPDVRVLACEVETAAPLAASLAASMPVQVSYIASFVSGMGAPSVFPEMWPLAQQLLDGSLVVTLDQVRTAIRWLATNSHIIVEGAGAVPVAAALDGLAGRGKIACIVSGGNIDLQLLVSILQEEQS